MANSDLAKRLYEDIDDITEDDDCEVFSSYWELAKPLIDSLKVHKFYVRAEEGYTNVGILAGGVVIDIEAIEDDEQGFISVYRIDAISGVSFYEDSVPSVPDSDEAELVVVANSAHSNELLLYWMAHNQEDAKRLAEFGRALASLFPDPNT